MECEWYQRHRRSTSVDKECDQVEAQLKNEDVNIEIRTDGRGTGLAEGGREDSQVGFPLGDDGRTLPFGGTCYGRSKYVSNDGTKCGEGLVTSVSRAKCNARPIFDNGFIGSYGPESDSRSRYGHLSGSDDCLQCNNTPTFDRGSEFYNGPNCLDGPNIDDRPSGGLPFDGRSQNEMRGQKCHAGLKFDDGPKPHDGPKCVDGAFDCDDDHQASTNLEETVGGRQSEGGWGWLVVLGAAIVNMMFGINYRMFGLVYLEMRDKFQASATASVWVGGINLLLGGFCGPLGACLLGRYSHRAVGAAGTTLAVVGMVGTGYVPNLPLAYVTYGLFTGVGIALVHISAVALVGQYFEKRKALALAVQSVTSGISAVIFSPLMALLFAEFGYPGTFVIFGGIFTHMYIASALFRPPEDKDVSCKEAVLHEQVDDPKDGCVAVRQNSGDESCAPHPAEVVEVDRRYIENGHVIGKLAAEGIDKHCKGGDSAGMCNGFAMWTPQTKHLSFGTSENKYGPVVEKQLTLCSGCKSMRVAMQNPVFVSFFLLLLSVTAGRAVTSSFLPALAVEFGCTRTEAAFLPAISGLAASVGTLIVGAAFDAKPIKKYRVYLYSVHTFIIGATMLWMPLTSTFYGLAIPTAINGISSTVIFAQQMTVLTDLLGKEHAVAGFGVVRVALALGSIIGRSISGIFFDTMATNKFGFYITSGLPMLGSAVFIVLVFLNSRRNVAVVMETVERGASV